MKEFWDQRFSSEEYIYGEKPNEYFKTILDRFDPGEILFAAEGEGRNAVYAAGEAWKVAAFDQSAEGKKKAEKLALKKGVEIDYRLGNLPELGFEKEEFDAVSLIFAHFPVELRASYHKLLLSYLRPKGLVIFEAFSKEHVDFQKKNPSIGGPKDEQLLFSLEEIQRDFGELMFLELCKAEVELKEGNSHNGMASVIHFVAQKIK